MKSKVALLVLSALALGSTAHAAEIFNKDGNKLDLYGKVKGERDFGGDNNTDATYARLGFRGETQIAQDVTGYGQFEHQFDVSKPEGSQTEKTRLAFAGLNFGDAGSIDYGRNYGIVYDIGGYADNLTEFGGDSYQGTDNFMTGRTTGVLTYRNSNFFGLVDGLALGIQYQGKNEADGSRAAAKSNGGGFGYSLQYELPDSGLTVGGAYSNAEAVDTAGYASGARAEAWTVGTKYSANALYLATTYAETRNMTPIDLYANGKKTSTIAADKVKAFEVMAGYTFDFGLNPTVGYVQQKISDPRSVGGYTTKYVELGAAYFFNKNFSVDAAYKFNLAKSSDTPNTDDQAVLGATYQF
ncbi:porin [Salmonella enterica]|nr:porin [Salmonella enterica]EAO0118499.1 porin [Salmonella enterica]EAO3601604.1 porin [Salmonella enterica]EAR6391497.1 porin [Salmonella enterica]EAV1285261.1 porin [Salmonella enterica]